MAPFYEEEMIMLFSGLLTSIPSMLLSIGSYVLTALAIYTLSRRRGLRNPWLAWIPVANCWLLGSLSDQYRYLVRGENKSRRKWLLILNILMCVLTAAVVILAIVVAGTAIFGNYRMESQLMSRIMGPLIAMAGLCLPMAGVAIAYAVIRYIALYDVYKSMDPANSVLFLVMSILFGVTEPFFLFFNRNKDQGMPPRKQEPVYAQAEPVYTQPEEPVRQPQEPESDKDYL